MIINVTELRPGNYFKDKDQIFVVLDINFNKTAMRKMIAKAKVKNLKTGSIIEISHNSGYNVDTIHVNKEKKTFLYVNNDEFIFANTKTYEQIEINKKMLEWESNFLTPGIEVEIISYNNDFLGVLLPPKIPMKVIECDPNGSTNDTIKNQMKNAILETNFKIKVPRFINVGDMIYVKTEDGTYSERAKN